jgi:hypothetical protein
MLIAQVESRKTGSLESRFQAANPAGMQAFYGDRMVG